MERPILSIDQKDIIALARVSRMRKSLHALLPDIYLTSSFSNTSRFLEFSHIAQNIMARHGMFGSFSLPDMPSMPRVRSDKILRWIKENSAMPAVEKMAAHTLAVFCWNKFVLEYEDILLTVGVRESDSSFSEIVNCALTPSQVSLLSVQLINASLPHPSGERDVDLAIKTVRDTMRRFVESISKLLIDDDELEPHRSIAIDFNRRSCENVIERLSNATSTIGRVARDCAKATWALLTQPSVRANAVAFALCLRTRSEGACAVAIAPVMRAIKPTIPSPFS